MSLELTVSSKPTIGFGSGLFQRVFQKKIHQDRKSNYGYPLPQKSQQTTYLNDTIVEMLYEGKNLLK